MINYGKFTRYNENDISNGMLLKNENDEDWYENYAWVKEEGYYILVDDDGNVSSFNKDISMLTPYNLFVYELETIPENFENEFYMFKIINNELVNTNAKQAAESKKRKIITETSEKINILTYAKEYGIITPEESTELEYLKKYLVFINRISTNDPSNIKWEYDQ